MSDGTRPPFRRLLVANRGEIAVRIIRTCRDLGVEAIAVYSDADAAARHVRLADHAVHIGPSAPGGSYLRIDRIMEAARASGAEAIHPGYGFLSEQAAFAAHCEEAGLAWIGPAPATLAGLGDKIAARRSAAEAGVPIVPGTLEPIVVAPDAADAVRSEAEGIGWPLLVKAAGGGGGRGMRRVDGADALLAAVAAASREAQAAFGSAAVYLERYIERARHIEVQLLGDAHGEIVALGERDCSVQRRHQKLVEEAPAPGLTVERRREVHELGVRIAGSVGLRNAATAEFLLTPDGRFFFLEVNARLQVEHGVTELVTDLDLVREQILVAAGQPLSAEVRAAAARAALPTRHAFEVRVSAEDPARGFAPMPGTIRHLHEPSGPGVRVDSGVEVGADVSAEYDPLLAKLLVVDADRDRALARLRRALEEFEVTGVPTTIPFHRWLARLPAFVEADLATDLVDRAWHPAPLREAAARRAAEAVAAAWPGPRPSVSVGIPAAAPGPDPWAAAGRRGAVERWP